LLGKSNGKRVLDRPRCEWEDDVKMDFQETGRDGVDWIHLAHDRIHKQNEYEILKSSAPMS